ncbi:MAG: hypothetical protein FWD45_02135 [Coriobacteriia bacterium]|nr:hypothetical protein [Coriobacteriia bacterium]
MIRLGSFGANSSQGFWRVLRLWSTVESPNKQQSTTNRNYRKTLITIISVVIALNLIPITVISIASEVDESALTAMADEHSDSTLKNDATDLDVLHDNASSADEVDAGDDSKPDDQPAADDESTADNDVLSQIEPLSFEDDPKDEPVKDATNDSEPLGYAIAGDFIIRFTVAAPTAPAAHPASSSTILYAIVGEPLSSITPLADDMAPIEGTHYIYADGVLNIIAHDGFTIQMSPDAAIPTMDRIVVSADAQVTLQDVSIDQSATGVFGQIAYPTVGNPAFEVTGGSSVMLTIQGIVSLSGGVLCAGLQVTPGNAIEIMEISTGTLYATSGRGGAGIGGGWSGESDHWQSDAGMITIAGGTIIAQAESGGAAIGGGNYGSGGIIRISGGEIYAIADEGAGIGGGTESIFIVYDWFQPGRSCGDILITGGVISVVGGNISAGIGGGGSHGNAPGDSIVIEGTAIVSAVGITGIGGGAAGGIDTIIIRGNTNVSATGRSGAGIGSGSWATGHKGTILIADNARVYAKGESGAGIGGSFGKIGFLMAPEAAGFGAPSGDITITGNAIVSAFGSMLCPGIGSGGALSAPADLEDYMPGVTPLIGTPGEVGTIIIDTAGSVVAQSGGGTAAIGYGGVATAAGKPVLPFAPTDLVATISTDPVEVDYGEAAVSLTWSSPDNISSYSSVGYEVTMDGGVTWVAADSISEHRFSGVSLGDTCLLSVRATFSYGFGLEAEVKKLDIPETGRDLMVVSMAGGSGAIEGTHYTYDNNVLVIIEPGEYIVSMAPGIDMTTTDGLVIAADAQILLYHINIDLSSTGNGSAYFPEPGSPAIWVTNNATAHITLNGTNQLKGGACSAGLQVTPGNAVIITDESTGTLSATGGPLAAGIGGGWGAWPSGAIEGFIAADCGYVEIAGGTVNASALKAGAGIGGGNYGSGGVIRISGGSVNATSASGAGIGGGIEEIYEIADWFPSGKGSGDIIISGGTVYAQSTSWCSAGIGGAGAHGYLADDRIVIEGDAVVTASGMSGIGGGAFGGIGTIVIRGEAHVSAYGNQGVGIGTGGWGTNAAGSILIDGNSVVSATGNKGAGIGGAHGRPGFMLEPEAAGYGSPSGDITITGSSTVVAQGSYLCPGIGSGGADSTPEYVLVLYPDVTPQIGVPGTLGTIIIDTAGTVTATSGGGTAAIGYGGVESAAGAPVLPFAPLELTVVEEDAGAGDGSGAGAGDADDVSLLLTWSAAVNFNSFKNAFYQISIDGGNTWVTAQSNTEHRFEGLLAGETYLVLIRVAFDNGFGVIAEPYEMLIAERGDTGGGGQTGGGTTGQNTGTGNKTVSQPTQTSKTGDTSGQILVAAAAMVLTGIWLCMRGARHRRLN